MESSGEMAKEDMSHWQLHAIYYPPLLRSASVSMTYPCMFTVSCLPDQPCSLPPGGGVANASVGPAVVAVGVV